MGGKKREKEYRGQKTFDFWSKFPNFGHSVCAPKLIVLAPPAGKVKILNVAGPHSCLWTLKVAPPGIFGCC